MAESVTSAVASIGRVAEYWMSDPARAAEAQAAIATPFLQLWAQTYRRLQGEAVEPVVPLAKGDKRFAAADWRENPLFDFLRQAHTIGATWAEQLAEQSRDVDPQTRAKAKFYLRQITSALSPSNFVATNPELLRETISSSGDNLARGAALLAEDIEAGHGRLRIRQTDEEGITLGVNVAATPGKVVFRNALIELIQYAPTTETVLRRPLLIVPPWINKYYILDLNPEKSFVRWAVAQGLTVFMISWVNPDERHRDKGFEAYIEEGIFAALQAVERATGEAKVGAIGYCVGGTLLSTALALMAATGDERIDSATLFAAQTDFTDAGEIQVFIDRDQVKALEAEMEGPGYLEGSKMAMAFNMLRPNDLIWSYVVDNYLKGQSAAGLRPALMERRFDAAAGAQPLLLPPQLLHGQQARQGRAGDQRRAAVARPGHRPDLLAGDQGGPHRAGRLGVPRGQAVRRPDAFRSRRLRPYRRHRQPAEQGQIRLCHRAAALRHAGRLDAQEPSRRREAGGRTGSPGCRRRRPSGCPRARRAKALCPPSATPRASTCGSES